MKDVSGNGFTAGCRLPVWGGTAAALRLYPPDGGSVETMGASSVQREVWHAFGVETPRADVSTLRIRV